MGDYVDDTANLKEISVGHTFLKTRTGRPSFFHVKTNLTMGGWFNASKSYMDLDVTGGVTGLASAHVMELRLPSTVQAGGHLTIAEHELVTQASTTVNTNVSMGWYQVSGDNTAKQHYLDTGTLFEFTGFDEASGNIFSAGGGALTTAGTLRIKVDDAVYYIMLSNGEAN